MPSFPAAIRAAALAHRAALGRREAASAALMMRAYGIVATRLEREIAGVLEAVEQMRATGLTDRDIEILLARRRIQQLRGETADAAARRTLTRYQSLLEQTDRGMTIYGAMVNQRITAEQAAVVDLALVHSRELLELTVDGSFTRLPRETLQDLVGVLADGSPLSKLLNTFGPQAAQKAGDALIEAVGLGLSPRTIAGDVRRALGTTASRALMISRTEVLNAYRRANLMTYRANADILAGWRWHSANDDRTCFPAGTFIATSRGPMPIERISVGEWVLSHEGVYRPVAATSKSFYTDTVVTVTAEGTTVAATSEHPFLIERQGKLEWVEAADLRCGMSVLCYAQGIRDIHNHIRRNRPPIERRSDKSYNSKTTRLQKQRLAAVLLGSMPVWLVNLQGDIENRNVKINRVRSGLKFLHKLNFAKREDQTCISFRLSFARKAAIAVERAEATSAQRTRHNAKFFAAVQTGNKNRRAAALFRAVAPIFTGHAKDFMAALALGIDCIGTLAFNRAMREPVRDAWRLSKLFTASWARLFNIRSILPAFNRAVSEHLTVMCCAKNLAALLALLLLSRRGRLAARIPALRMSPLIQAIARRRAKSLFVSFGVRRRQAKPLTTFKTGKRDTLIEMLRKSLRSTLRSTISIDLSAVANIHPSIRSAYSADTLELPTNTLYFNPFHPSIITDIAYQNNASITVYNLEVEGDHSYVANGFVVHNCDRCKSLHGQLFPIDAVMDEHPQGRCAPVPVTKSYAEILAS